MEVRVYWTREACRGADLEGWQAAVVDCLRATTSVAAALAAGARRVLPCDDEGAARAHVGAVLAGERELAPLPGFDLGNSPAAFTPEAVAGRDVVLFTTNGSRALLDAARAGAGVTAFALVNAGAVARSLRAAPRLAIVCAGTRGRFGLDDAIAAGALLARLAETEPGPRAGGWDDAALASLLLFRAGAADPGRALAATRAGRHLGEAGYAADVAFCAQLDRFAVVPRLRDGALWAT